MDLTLYLYVQTNPNKTEVWFVTWILKWNIRSTKVLFKSIELILYNWDIISNKSQKGIWSGITQPLLYFYTNGNIGFWNLNVIGLLGKDFIHYYVIKLVCMWVSGFQFQCATKLLRIQNWLFSQFLSLSIHVFSFILQFFIFVCTIILHIGCFYGLPRERVGLSNR